jgi:uncharacterized protein YidB (DUF937 family)
MGLLDDVLNKTAGVAPAQDGSQNSLVTAVLSILSSQSGGLSGLVQQFAANGFGQVVNSWVSTGKNLPITSEQLQTALGSEQIQAIAAKAGISPETAQSSLTQLLPQLVDHLTPDGEVPQGDLMSKGMELLKGKLFS